LGNDNQLKKINQENIEIDNDIKGGVDENMIKNFRDSQIKYEYENFKKLVEYWSKDDNIIEHINNINNSKFEIRDNDEIKSSKKRKNINKDTKQNVKREKK
jgi:hypothetical protein